MFTIKQIKVAHSQVKSGIDFPKYVQELIKLGVLSYNTYVTDGHTEYLGKDHYHIQSEAIHPNFNVADVSDKEKFRKCLKIHQLGQTDYLTFSKHSAESGVEKWKVDTVKMTCTYYDKQGDKLLVEDIPTP